MSFCRWNKTDSDVYCYEDESGTYTIEIKRDNIHGLTLVMATAKECRDVLALMRSGGLKVQQSAIDLLEREYRCVDGCGHEFRDGVFCGGVFRCGEFRGGEFRGGEFSGGVFSGGVFSGGVFCDGVFCGGVFCGGAFRGGVFRGGEWRAPENRLLYMAAMLGIVFDPDGYATAYRSTHADGRGRYRSLFSQPGGEFFEPACAPAGAGTCSPGIHVSSAAIAYTYFGIDRSAQLWRVKFHRDDLLDCDGQKARIRGGHFEKIPWPFLAQPEGEK